MSVRWSSNRCAFAGFSLMLVLGFLLPGPRDCAAQKSKVSQAEEKIKTSRQALRELEDQIQEDSARAKGLGKKEQSLVRQIHDYEVQIDSSMKTLRALSIEVEELTGEIEYIIRQLERCGEQLEAKKAILNRRLRGIFKQGRLHQAAVLLGSHSFTDLVRRYKYLTLIAQQDKRLVNEVAELRHSYSELKLTSEYKLSQKLERKAEEEAEQEALKNAEQGRQKLLSSVKTQKAEVLNRLAEREVEKKRIGQVIAEWERRRLEAIAQAKKEGRVLPPEVAHLDGQQGKLRWPVAGGTMIRGFGPYTDEITKTRVVNNGVDIKAESGQDVRCVGDGSVIYVDWYRTYGKTVMIYHGGGILSLYTHLGEVFVVVGDQVSEGQTIALIGSTGSLEGPMLHFEIRDGSRAVDPLAWLRR